MIRILLIMSFIFSISAFSKNKLKEKVPTIMSKVNVVIKGGKFEPDVIGIKSKGSTVINFEMKDDYLCKKKIRFRNLGIEVPILINKKTSITLKDIKPGRYHMECETGAFCGVLYVIEDNENSSGHYYAPHPE